MESHSGSGVTRCRPDKRETPFDGWVLVFSRRLHLPLGPSVDEVRQNARDWCTGLAPTWGTCDWRTGLVPSWDTLDWRTGLAPAWGPRD